MKNLTVYPNQKVIQIHSADKKYTSPSLIADNIANETLSAVAYKLFCYIRNKRCLCDGYWALSSKDAYKLPSVTENTYPKAIQELIDKKYLVQKPVICFGKTYIKDSYHFFELPKEYDTREKKADKTEKVTYNSNVRPNREVALSDETF